MKMTKERDSELGANLMEMIQYEKQGKDGKKYRTDHQSTMGQQKVQYLCHKTPEDRERMWC